MKQLHFITKKNKYILFSKVPAKIEQQSDPMLHNWLVSGQILKTY
jgi:hypothetical protein